MYNESIKFCKEIFLMNVDVWFFKQSKAVQILLLCIPVCGWVIDALVRWSIYLKKQTTKNLVMAIVVTVLFYWWVPTVFDAIWYGVNGTLFFQE